MHHRLPVRCFVFALMSLCLAGPAAAQSSPAATNSLPGRVDAPSRAFDVKRLSFESWCQEIQRYAVERCDARRQDDVLAFDSYRSIVERYEVDLLRQQQQRQEVQDRVNRDPTSTVQTLMGSPAQ